MGLWRVTPADGDVSTSRSLCLLGDPAAEDEASEPGGLAVRGLDGWSAPGTRASVGMGARAPAE
jgi:hypothetical protein